MFAPPSSGSASSIRSRSTTTTTPGTHTRTSTGRRITSSIRPGASATSTSVRGTTTRPSATSGCYSRPVEAVPCHPIHAGNIGVRLYVRLALRLLRWTALLVGTAVPTLPLAQEACELGGERLARGQVLLGIELLGPLLEARARRGCKSPGGLSRAASNLFHLFFLFNDSATNEIYPLSLPVALTI